MEKQQVANLIRSLIRQLSARYSTIPPPLKALYDVCHGGGSKPSVESLQKTLLQVLETFQHAYIIIDSLDECAERKLFLNWIEAINTWNKGKLHLLVTSRNGHDIVERLSLLDHDHVSMKPEHINTDIEKFIDYTLETEEFQRWDEDEKAKIKSKLLGSAEGMYDPFHHKFSF